MKQQSIIYSPQLERPFIVHGEPFNKLPEDLYIPPDALEIILETFEGPLDLLLYLIKKQNLDILNIPMALITRQYMEYIRLMENKHFELAAEYLVMAAMLMEIKSQILLPRMPVDGEEEDADPRAELARRLLEYERYKKAAESFETLPRQERDFFVVQRKCATTDDIARPLASVSLESLLTAFQDVMERLKNRAHHCIQREVLSVSDRIELILKRLHSPAPIHFHALFTLSEGRMGVVVTFMAILELVKQAVIELTQGEPFEPISIRRV